MKKFSNFLILLSLIFVQSVYSQNDTNYRVIQNNAFTFGERLSFEISYGFLTAAEAFLTVSPGPVVFDGRDAYEVNMEVNSRSTFDAVYKVRDNYKTFIDTKGMFPWRFEQHIRENDYKRDFEINFEQRNNKIVTKLGPEIKEYPNIPHYVHDILSAFYYCRTLDYSNMREGEKINMQYFYKEGLYPLDVIFKGREEVDVDAGEFKTIILEPQLQEGFTSTTSDITVWLTDDDRKIPVKVKMKIVIGSLIAELTEYKGLNGPLNSKID